MKEIPSTMLNLITRWNNKMETFVGAYIDCLLGACVTHISWVHVNKVHPYSTSVHDTNNAITDTNNTITVRNDRCKELYLIPNTMIIKIITTLFVLMY